MKWLPFTPFIFFFIAACVLFSISAVSAGVKADGHENPIDKKIGQLEDRIQQLKGTPKDETFSFEERLSINWKNFKSEAQVRLVEFRENTKEIGADLEERLYEFAADVKKFFNAVREEYSARMMEASSSKMAQIH